MFVEEPFDLRHDRGRLLRVQPVTGARDGDDARGGEEGVDARLVAFSQVVGTLPPQEQASRCPSRRAMVRQLVPEPNRPCSTSACGPWPMTVDASETGMSCRTLQASGAGRFAR